MAVIKIVFLILLKDTSVFYVKKTVKMMASLTITNSDLELRILVRNDRNDRNDI